MTSFLRSIIEQIKVKVDVCLGTWESIEYETAKVCIVSSERNRHTSNDRAVIEQVSMNKRIPNFSMV
jgi:hypothetical protein